jgi:DNA-binding NarL/FixJ family response regulator
MTSTYGRVGAKLLTGSVDDPFRGRHDKFHAGLRIDQGRCECFVVERKHRPDVTLLDLQMPELGGIDAIKTIREEFPEARIIILTTHKGDAQVLSALRSGAQAYLLKSTLRRELLDTIRAVYRGQKRIPPDVAAQLAEHAADDPLTRRAIKPRLSWRGYKAL